MYLESVHHLRAQRARRGWPKGHPVQPLHVLHQEASPGGSRDAHRSSHRAREGPRHLVLVAELPSRTPAK